MLDGSQCICPDSTPFTGSCACTESTIEGDCLYCGNGIIDLGETCDDGNIESQDGCSEECQTEDSFNCNVSVSPTQCATVAPFSISQIQFTTSVNGITVTLQFSTKVMIQGKHLLIFRFYGFKNPSEPFIPTHYYDLSLKCGRTRACQRSELYYQPSNQSCCLNGSIFVISRALNLHLTLLSFSHLTQIQKCLRISPKYPSFLATTTSTQSCLT